MRQVWLLLLLLLPAAHVLAVRVRLRRPARQLYELSPFDWSTFDSIPLLFPSKRNPIEPIELQPQQYRIKLCGALPVAANPLPAYITRAADHELVKLNHLKRNTWDVDVESVPLRPNVNVYPIVIRKGAEYLTANAFNPVPHLTSDREKALLLVPWRNKRGYVYLQVLGGNVWLSHVGDMLGFAVTEKPDTKFEFKARHETIEPIRFPLYRLSPYEFEEPLIQRSSHRPHRFIAPCELLAGRYEIHVHGSIATTLSVVEDASTTRLRLSRLKSQVWQVVEKPTLRGLGEYKPFALRALDRPFLGAELGTRHAFMSREEQYEPTLVPWCDQNQRVYLQVLGGNVWLTREKTVLHFAVRGSPLTAFRFTPHDHGRDTPRMDLSFLASSSFHIDNDDDQSILV